MATLQSGKCFTVPTFLECVAGLNDRKGCIFTNDMKLTRQTWNILCSYCLQWNTSQSKFRNHYFLFYLRFPYCPNFFWFGVVLVKIASIAYWLARYISLQWGGKITVFEVSLIACRERRADAGSHTQLSSLSLSLSVSLANSHKWLINSNKCDLTALHLCVWFKVRRMLTSLNWRKWP